MIGQALGHYRIDAKLGEGGMGVVYRAFDTHLERPVAIKILRADATTNPERRQRFRQEAKAASALNHPNIVHIYDISSCGDTDYIAMEFVEGKTLHELIGTNGLGLGDALKYAIPVADALACAHAAGIVHRDLKPANIMIGEDGRVRLLDFGLAKLTQPSLDADINSEAGTATMAVRENVLTQEGRVLGTAAYMSPEQAEGKKVDARSDIFSFGAVLYEMVSGRRAFEGANTISILFAIVHNTPPALAEVAPDLPPELDRIISRCLRKDPDRRAQHAADVKLAVEELRDDLASGARSRTSQVPPRTDQQPTLVRRLLGSLGAKVYQLWEILHIKICLRCILLVYLALRFKGVTSGTWGVALFFATLICCAVQSILACVLLIAGAVDIELLHEVAPQFSLWIRVFGVANGALGIIMAASIAADHTIMAAIIACLGVAIGITALTLKPALDRAAAIYDSKSLSGRHS